MSRRDELVARIRDVGRAAVTKEEMLRLGFWPPAAIPPSARPSESARWRSCGRLKPT